MGVGEQYSSLGQSVDVRRVNILSTTEAVDPIVEVVDRDEQYVWTCLLSLGGLCAWLEYDRRNEKQRHRDLHVTK